MKANLFQQVHQNVCSSWMLERDSNMCIYIYIYRWNRLVNIVYDECEWEPSCVRQTARRSKNNNQYWTSCTHIIFRPSIIYTWEIALATLNNHLVYIYRTYLFHRKHIHTIHIYFCSILNRYIHRANKQEFFFIDLPSWQVAKIVSALTRQEGVGEEEGGGCRRLLPHVEHSSMSLFAIFSMSQAKSTNKMSHVRVN